MARGLPSSPLVVHRTSGTPVHVQIASWLRTAIAAGELAPGDRLVGERELAERLGVTGTPTLVAADGRVLPGAASAEQISAWLSRSTTSAEGPTPSSPAAQATGKAP